MVTHDPKAAAFAQRIIFLQDGKVINDFTSKKEIDHGRRLRYIITKLERLG